MARKSLNEELSRINQLSGQNPIREANISFDSEFETSKVDTDVYHINQLIKTEEGNEVEVSEIQSTIYWELDPDMRSWGIKSMGVVIRNLTANIYWEINEWSEQDLRDYNKSSGEIEFDLSSPQFKDWKIINELEFQHDGQIYPTYVQIDFANKTVTVS
jgi:hypothetical protein